jgi:pyridoxine 5-phosphate synthase
MTKLGVNIDHIATIRQARQALEPDPVAAAILSELAGADGITVHLRGDRRHIQDRDVKRLRETVTTRLNIEMAVTQEMIRIAAELHPDQVTFVAERAGEITTEGGLNVAGASKPIASAIKRLKKEGIQTSLFIDPDAQQVRIAADLGTAMAELNTRAYSETCLRSPDLGGPEMTKQLRKLAEIAKYGSEKGMQILAGHGLTYRNVRAVSDIPEVVELNIGHNIIARAALVGLERAVREMLQAMGRQ